MAIGKKIKSLLDKKGMTVTDLSRATGIPVTTLYSMIRRDRNSERIDMLRKIASALEVSVLTLLPLEEAEFRLSNIQRDIDDLKLFIEKDRLEEIREYQNTIKKILELNDEGQTKVGIYVDDLLGNPKYGKDTKKKEE